MSSAIFAPTLFLLASVVLDWRAEVTVHDCRLLGPCWSYRQQEQYRYVRDRLDSQLELYPWDGQLTRRRRECRFIYACHDALCDAWELLDAGTTDGEGNASLMDPGFVAYRLGRLRDLKRLLGPWYWHQRQMPPMTPP